MHVKTHIHISIHTHTFPKPGRPRAVRRKPDGGGYWTDLKTSFKMEDRLTLDLARINSIPRNVSIFLKAKVEQKEVRFVVDTGSRLSSISRRFVR